MSMTMTAVDDALVGVETADVVDCVLFSYLFIFLVIK